ncbi:hypothetical protein DHEL01_v203768 [Diaporthe helianthi]|uniref:Uncharacterized protein n=1 Tax=Diaporthe helianthi TaxID=158607 RepID=A0A2P5I5R8_DIAHE|nr:hypothetical protein DHEL01_v203768 [Diaporthe helianthi]
MKFMFALSILSSALALPDIWSLVPPSTHGLLEQKKQPYSLQRRCQRTAFVRVPRRFASKSSYIHMTSQWYDIMTNRLLEDARGKAHRPGKVPLTNQYGGSGGLQEDVASYGLLTIAPGDGNAQTFQVWVYYMCTLLTPSQPLSL